MLDSLEAEAQHQYILKTQLVHVMNTRGEKQWFPHFSVYQNAPDG